MNTLLHILKQHQLTESDILLVQSIASVKNVKTYKTLIDYYEKCQTIYFVLKGRYNFKIVKKFIVLNFAFLYCLER